MQKITLKIEGMACVKCEAHMDEAIKEAFSVKKVSSSHSDKQTVIIAKDDIDDAKLKAVVEETGYELLGITREPYEKKGFFSFFKK